MDSMDSSAYNIANRAMAPPNKVPAITSLREILIQAEVLATSTGGSFPTEVERDSVKVWKNWVASFIAVFFIKLPPNWANLPPISAFTSYVRVVELLFSRSVTWAVTFALPAGPPEPSPLIV